MSECWGIHGGIPGTDFVRDRVLVLERPGVGDLRLIGDDRAELKRVLANEYRDRKPGVIAAWAGVLLRFAFEAQPGDLLVHPDKTTRTVSIGTLDGEYFWDDAGRVDRHCRRVTWLRTRVPRDHLSGPLQTSISARPAFFAVRNPLGELADLAR